MKSLARLMVLLLSLTLLQVIPTTAHASCAEFPDSTTDACIAENLAAEQARQAAYAAKQAADAAAVQAAADAQRAQQAADDAARAAAASGLPADSCGRPENSGSNKCSQERMAAAQATADSAASQQMAAQSAAEIEQRKAWGIYDPALGDCSQAPNSLTAGCVAQNLLAAQHLKADQIARMAVDNQRAVDSATAQAVQQNSAEIAKRKAWGIYDPALGDCSQAPNSLTAGCVAQNLLAAQHLKADQIARMAVDNQRAVDSATAQAVQQNSAEIAKRKAWGIYDPALGDCSQAPNSLTVGCVAQNLVAEKFRSAEYVKEQADASSSATKRAAEAKAAQALADAKARAKLLKGTIYSKSDSMTTTSSASQKSLTCVKGKISKVITDASPKCPAGYKKK